MYSQKINRQKEIFGWFICIFQTFYGFNKMDFCLSMFTFIYGEKEIKQSQTLGKRRFVKNKKNLRNQKLFGMD